ncbi:MAG: helix-turn-helix domain-containing protein [Candidatus Dojkabacteria bacterium]
MKRDYIGENIRIYRERANLTQQELADKVGVSWEMISRYERLASSPVNKIEKLADALGVKKSQLMEEHIPSSINSMDLRVPLFTRIPIPPRFSPTQTNYYYQCPEWILINHKGVIALDNSIVQSNVVTLSTQGLLYVSTEYKLKGDEYIVVKNSTTLEVKKYQGENSEKILGILIAQEVRY